MTSAGAKGPEFPSPCFYSLPTCVSGEEEEKKKIKKHFFLFREVILGLRRSLQE